MQGEVIKAIQYRSLDEAKEILEKATGRTELLEVLDDAGEEPEGLLSVIPEDRVGEEVFIRLVNAEKGVLVEVERVPYSGYGPPAAEGDYMGYVSEQSAYVMKGCRLPVEIEDCPEGARDFHHLDAMVLDGQHPINREDLADRLDLPANWDFDTLFEMILDDRISAEEIDRAIHRGIQ